MRWASAAAARRPGCRRSRPRPAHAGRCPSTRSSRRAPATRRWSATGGRCGDPRPDTSPRPPRCGRWRTARRPGRDGDRGRRTARRGGAHATPRRRCSAAAPGWGAPGTRSNTWPRRRSRRAGRASGAPRAGGTGRGDVGCGRPRWPTSPSRDRRRRRSGRGCWRSARRSDQGRSRSRAGSRQPHDHRRVRAHAARTGSRTPTRACRRSRRSRPRSPRRRRCRRASPRGLAATSPVPSSWSPVALPHRPGLPLLTLSDPSILANSISDPFPIPFRQDERQEVGLRSARAGNPAGE